MALKGRHELHYVGDLLHLCGGDGPHPAAGLKAPSGSRPAAPVDGVTPVAAAVVVPVAGGVPEAKFQSGGPLPPAAVAHLNGRLKPMGPHRVHDRLLDILPRTRAVAVVQDNA